MTKISRVARACGILLVCATAAIPLHAQTFKRLHLFQGTDGGSPEGLVQGANGNLYGLAAAGGATDENAGTIFGITTGGTFKALYDFCPQTGCPDGENPFGAPAQGTDGNFYGATLNGGANAKCLEGGCGSVFAITPTGTFKTIYSFCALSNCADGKNPPAGLVLGRDGNLYGTTQTGGPTAGCPGGCGTVFKITTTGVLTTLYDFCSEEECADGVDPDTALLLGQDGNFYGTTTGGGAALRGVVFQITPAGALTVLYNFCTQANCTDGLSPEAALVQGSDGNFYGSTTGGGADNIGILFRLTPSGQFTILHVLCSEASCADGSGASPMVQATDGDFYGTMNRGGSHGDGAIFQMSSTGTYNVLYNFCSQTDCADGIFPAAGVMQDTNGTFYGTATTDGYTGHGTIYSLNTGLGPFVGLLPDSGKTDSKMAILGTDLSGASRVTFNGTAAAFAVKSKTLIVATVPSGATSGTINVQLSGGSLSSNVPFIVLP